MSRHAAPHRTSGFLHRDSKGPHPGHSSKSHSLEAEIDRFELQERYKSYLFNHYLSLHITVVSVVLAAAGLSAASLIAQHMGAHHQLLVLWLLWGGSLAATAVAYGGPMVGAFALPATIPSIIDLLLPLLVGVSEFLLFTVLISQVNPAPLDSIVNSWLIIMAIFSFVADLSVLRARQLYSIGRREEAYSKEVADMIYRYLGHLTLDACAATVATAVAAAGAGLRIAGFVRWPAIFPIVITALLTAGLWGHQSVVRMWRRELTPGKVAVYHHALGAARKNDN